jgi:hypothetical protein
MSSETSTESQSLQSWQFFTLAGLIGATIVVFFARGQTPAAVILLSLTIFAAAAVGVAALRTLAPLASGTAPEAPRVVGGATQAALWREKALVLRSIKELEFDRAMGKVSDKDFAEMSARLRARAGRLIRQLDAGGTYREAIEREIAARLGAPASPTPTTAAPASEPMTEAAEAPASDEMIGGRTGDVLAGRTLCRGCHVLNDGDARFCKGCGASLEVES